MFMNQCKRCGFSLWPGLVACPSCGAAIPTPDNDSIGQTFPGMDAPTVASNPFNEAAQTLYAPQRASGQSFVDDSEETQFADYGVAPPNFPQSSPPQQPLSSTLPFQQLLYSGGQAPVGEQPYLVSAPPANAQIQQPAPD